MAAPAPAHPFRSTVYGLTIASNVRVGAPAPTGSEVDVVLDWVGVIAPECRGDGHAPAPHESRRIVEPTGGWLEATPGPGAPGAPGAGTRLRFGYLSHQVRFDITAGGDRVAISWTPDVAATHVQTLLLTTVMGYLLHCRGRLATHASVVLRRSAAFVLAGNRGSGKSTTAAALVARGCTPVSDDVAALTQGRQRWEVAPGPAGMRLAPDSRTALGVPAAATMPVWPLPPSMADVDVERLEDKAVVGLGDAGPAALPLAGIFLLPPGVPAPSSRARPPWRPSSPCRAWSPTSSPRRGSSGRSTPIASGRLPTSPVPPLCWPWTGPTPWRRCPACAT